MTQKLLSGKELKKKLAGLSDERYIKALETLISFEFGLSALDWIEYKYHQGGTGTVEFINNL